MHLRYLRYVLRHKWYVFLECCKYGLYWRGIIHDWSKFTMAEWGPYAQSFYGRWEYDSRPQWLVDEFDRAWLHHQHANSHHWQHWILREDSGALKVLDMPWADMAEMVADWRGAGKAQGKPDTKVWYLENCSKILLSEWTRAFVETELGLSNPEKTDLWEKRKCTN